MGSLLKVLAAVAGENGECGETPRHASSGGLAATGEKWRTASPSSPRVSQPQSQPGQGISPHSPVSPSTNDSDPGPLTATDLAHLDHAFHSHIFGPGIHKNCCAPEHDRYCEEGQRLKDAYFHAFRLLERQKNPWRVSGFECIRSPMTKA